MTADLCEARTQAHWIRSEGKRQFTSLKKLRACEAKLHQTQRKDPNIVMGVSRLGSLAGMEITRRSTQGS